MMPFFKITGKTKYALDAIFLHAQLNAILSERDAFLLKWNRTVSKNGGAGRNIAVDQAMQHRVRVVKCIIEAHGANLNFNSAQLFSRATQTSFTKLL